MRAAAPFASVAAALSEASVAYEIFAEVHGNPTEEDVLAAAERYRASACDGFVGLGGGSPLDMAKAVVAKARHSGPLEELEAQAGGWERMTGPYDPVIAIPTNAGTGSEVGRSAVITSHRLGRKMIIFSPQLMTKRAILDPELTVGLPPALTATTGMDAFTHCLESWTCPVFHSLCDAMAVHGLELVVRYLERAVRNGTDIEARGNMQTAATTGAIALQKDLSAAHSLSRALSTEFGLNLRSGQCAVPARSDALQSAGSRIALRAPGGDVRPPCTPDERGQSGRARPGRGRAFPRPAGLRPRAAQPRRPA